MYRQSQIWCGVQLYLCKLILYSASQFPDTWTLIYLPYRLSSTWKKNIILRHTWELDAELSFLSRTELSDVVKSEFQPELWFPGLYDAPESNVEDCFALRILDI